jgi:uncharacterized repeat protein (TIGR01451 family)
MFTFLKVAQPIFDSNRKPLNKKHSTIKRSGSLIILLLLGGMLFTAQRPRAAGSFSDCPRFSEDVRGDIVLIGNISMECSGRPGSACDQSQRGRPPFGGNNDFFMDYTDIDGRDNNTFNSSSANLSLPLGAKVKFAGLYWRANVRKGEGENARDARDASKRGTVLFRAPGSGYVTLTTGDRRKECDKSRDLINPDDQSYRGFYNVTSLVTAAGSGDYTVANIQAGTGKLRSAGWSLIVAYEDQTPNTPLRNLSVYDGFIDFGGNAQDSVTLSGFKTLPVAAGPGASRLGIVAFEGDLRLRGDSLTLNGTTLVNNKGRENNFFNSSIADLGTRVSQRSPSYPNTMGIDVDRQDVPAGVIKNGEQRIRLRSPGEDGVTLVAVTLATTLEQPPIDLHVAKEAPEEVCVGETLTYTIRTENRGRAEAPGVVLKDVLPQNVDFVAASDGCSKIGGEVNCNLGNVPPTPPDDTGKVITITVKPAVAAGGSELLNTATISSAGSLESDPSNNTAEARTRVKELADLTVAQSTSKPEVCAGEELTYTITVTNNGPNKAPGVVLTDMLPANVNVSSLPPGCTRSDNIITCDVGTLDVNAKALLTFVIRPATEAAGTPITNCVSVRGDVCGDDPGNNQVCVLTPVRRKADLMVAMSASAAEVCVNDPLTYSARVTNKGPNSASDVVLTVTLPANVAIDAPLPSGCVNSANTITCNIGELIANAPPATFEFKIRPLPGAEMRIRLVASVTGNICDPATEPNQAEVITKVRPLVDLVVTKTGPSDPVCAGGEITYTVSFTNHGPDAAPNAKLADETPANTVFRSITPPPGSGFTCSGPPVDGTGTVICTNPSMAANTTVSFTLVARILPSTPDGAEITNTATVTSDACEKDLAKNKAMVKTGVVRRVDLSITKTGIVDPASPNMINPRLIYTITVSNKGGCSEAKNVELIDQILDRNYQYVHLLPNLTEGAKCTQYPTGKRQVVCVLAGTIASGDPPRTIKLVFETTSKTEKPTICNEVSIRSDTPDSNPEDDYDNFRIDVGGGRPRVCRFPTDKRAASK